MEVVNITCDLIVYSRWKKQNQDNIIAIEMKKKSHPDSENDKNRLKLKALKKTII